MEEQETLSQRLQTIHHGHKWLRNLPNSLYKGPP